MVEGRRAPAGAFHFGQKPIEIGKEVEAGLNLGPFTQVRPVALMHVARREGQFQIGLSNAS